MLGKLLFLGIINITIIFNLSYAEDNYESTVPPIQYPEKSNDEMQARKDIKNSFFKNDDINSNVNSNMNENNLTNKLNITPYVKDPTVEKPKPKSFEELMDRNIIKKKSEVKKGPQLNLMDQETPTRSSELWKIFMISTFFVSILGTLGYLLTKFRKKGIFSLTKSEKIMDIVSTLPISPKRQILILKIRDQEIVVSNTESGISFLTEISSGMSSRNIQEKRNFQLNDKYLLPKQEKNIFDKMEQKSEQNNISSEKLSEKKSDILLKALKSINSNNLNQKKNKAPDENQQIQNKTDNFPKYLANQFENESKKEIKKKEEDVDSVENVTNLIREKLRSMKPLN